MHFIFANNYYYLRGGSERVFFDEIDLLKSHDHDIAPFTRNFDKNNPSEYSLFFPPQLSYESVSVFKKIGTSAKLIYSRECNRYFARLLESFNPDIVHAHNIYGRLTSSIIDASKKSKKPVVMTLHDYKLICPSYLMLANGEICEKCMGGHLYHCFISRCHKGSFVSSAVYTAESYFNRAFKKYDHVSYFLCPSKFLLNKHREAGIPESKLIHLPNFIKLNAFEPNFTPGSYVLFAGRLSKEKGVLTLLRAIQGIDTQVKIVGDGPMRGAAETYVKEKEMKNVVFEGYKSGLELAALFKNAAFLVFPSEWYENFPMTILEAFAYGKPVIGADIGGIPEMVVNQSTGLLFKPKDADDLRAKIKYLIAENSLVTQMGMNARKTVEEKFNADKHYAELMKVYERAVK